MSGRIDWSANVVNAEDINNTGSFAPPSTWEKLKLALFDIIMPANSVEEYTIKLATFKTERVRLYPPPPSVSERLHSDLSRLLNATPKAVRLELR